MSRAGLLRAMSCVGLSLLTSAATAHAESAWALKDCNADLAGHVAVKKRQGDEVSDPRSGDRSVQKGRNTRVSSLPSPHRGPRGQKGK